VVHKPGLFDPGLVYNAHFDDFLGFMCEAGPDLLGGATGPTCRVLAAAGVPTSAEGLNLATIGVQALVGSRTVARRVTNVSGHALTLSAQRHAPRGYTLSVRPRILRVRAGGTATYRVRITNAGAPVGAWRFGDLTWRGGGYAVHSTIAVRGARIGAPASVAASGASGAVDVPVRFGYAGAYHAVPSGLVASRPLTGSVAQDPDQTFGSPDDGAGGVARLPVTIGPTSYWRLQYADPGSDDLDLYLLDASGKVVASSTAGGTNELIQLSHPPAGSYTLAVHGWQVAGTHRFAIDNWIVPSGRGSLAVTSAPTTATVAGTGTVRLAWAGATPAGVYYGALDHTDGPHRLGQTVVRVTGAG
jgi:hypothetical protein